MLATAAGGGVRRTVSMVMALAMICLGLAACSSSSPKSATRGGVQTITFINCGPELAPIEGAVLLAPQLGFLPGVTIKAVNSSGTGACVDAVATGQDDISGPGLEPVLDAVASGEQLNAKFFYETVRHDPFEIGVAANSSITSLKQLSGAVIGVASAGTIQQDYAEEILASVGVNPSKETYEAVGQGASALHALTSGSIKALVEEDNIWGQYKGLGQNSFRILPSPTTGTISQIPGASVIANGTWLKTHHDLAVRYATALTKAVLFQFANPVAVAKVFFKTYPQYLIPGKTLDQNVQAVMPEFEFQPESVWGYDAQHPLKHWGAFTTDQWAALLQVEGQANPTIKKLTPASLAPYWTNDIVNQIGSIDPAQIVKYAQNFKV